MTVPVIVNTLYVDYSGKNVISRAIHKYINEYCDGSNSFSMDNVEKLLNAGLCTIMFDDFETVGERQLTKINEFIKIHLSCTRRKKLINLLRMKIWILLYILF